MEPDSTGSLTDVRPPPLVVSSREDSGDGYTGAGLYKVARVVFRPCARFLTPFGMTRERGQWYFPGCESSPNKRLHL